MIRITTLLNIPPFNNVKKLTILSIYIIWDIFRIFFSKYTSVLFIRNVFNSGDFCFLKLKKKQRQMIRFSGSLMADYACEMT